MIKLNRSDRFDLTYNKTKKPKIKIFLTEINNFKIGISKINFSHELFLSPFFFTINFIDIEKYDNSIEEIKRSKIILDFFYSFLTYSF